MGNLGNLDVVRILGIGLSGFGFLLMYLAYRLIVRVMNFPPPPQPLVISTINRYMLVCFVMTLTVGIFTFISTSFKNAQVAQLSNKVNDQSFALSVLAASKKNDLLSDSIVNNIDDKQKVLIARNEQKKVLDTLSSYVSKVQNPELEHKFNKYRTAILRVSDSLQMVNLTRPKIDSLKEFYIQYNNSLSKFSLMVANEKGSNWEAIQ